MKISELFAGIQDVPEELKKREATGVTSDSREVEKGFAYVCIKGGSFDGHSVAEDMLKKGAACVVTQEPLGLSDEINVPDTRKLYARLLSNFYGNPTRKIKLGAVTGTNGKTTTVSLCAQITRALGHRTGIIGTLGTDTGDGLEYSHSGPPTTPEPRKLYRLFAQMAAESTEYCFIEASSQALAQYRFGAENFEAAAFTNLTRDHLDYHGTMENYFAAKSMLFDMCKTAVINIDDEYGRQLLEYCVRRRVPTITVSVKDEADIYAEFVKLDPHVATFVITDRARKKSYPTRFAMTGLYNVSNALEAVAMISVMGFPMDEIVKALQNVSGVSGRLETLYNGEFTVIRDYAHTGDGLRKLLGTLKPLTRGKLITVFGAAGERDAGKRPDMGAAAAEFSDCLIVTTDSPRFEDPQRTIDDVAAGIPKGVPYEGFTDRKEAVIRALALAEAGDTVALCGKGHEDYQAIGSVYTHFDEKEIVEEYLKDRNMK